jgi:hypothetical protein
MPIAPTAEAELHADGREASAPDPNQDSDDRVVHAADPERAVAKRVLPVDQAVRPAASATFGWITPRDQSRTPRNPSLT